MLADVDGFCYEEVSSLKSAFHERIQTSWSMSCEKYFHGVQVRKSILELQHPALEFEEQIVQSMSNLIEGIITLLQSEMVYGLLFHNRFDASER